MKSLIFLLIYLNLFIFSPSLLAGSGWTNYAKPSELIPTSRHYYEFKLDVKDNPSGCRHETQFYQDYSTFASDKMFAVLLDALKTNLKVRVYVTGRCNLDGASEISSVGIIP